MADHEALNNVRRKLNEVMKKTDEKIVVGWRPGLDQSRKEGEVWEDLDGRKWTVKNGIKQNVTKLDLAKTPWFCPACEKAMGHRLDTKYYNLRGKCMDCVIKEETQMRWNGTWAEYEREKLKQNYIGFLKDKIQEFQDYHDTVSAPEFLYADNEKILMMEKWDVNLTKVREDLLTEIAQLKELLTKVEAGEMDNLLAENL